MQDDPQQPVHITPRNGTPAAQPPVSAGASAPAPDAQGAEHVAIPSAPASEPATSFQADVTPDAVKIALRRVKDPELSLNIVDLGLIYDIRIDGNAVELDMSLTSPGCPSGPEIMTEAEKEVRTIEGIGDVSVNLVWSPPWTPERIEPRVRAYLGF